MAPPVLWSPPDEKLQAMGRCRLAAQPKSAVLARLGNPPPLPPPLVPVPPEGPPGLPLLIVPGSGARAAAEARAGRRPAPNQ